MFDYVIRTLQARQIIWSAALTGSTETAVLLAERGAQQGQEHAGALGGMYGGALGWAYGTVAGLWMNAYNGAMLGAKSYVTQPSSAAKPAPKQALAQSETATANEATAHPKARKSK